MSYVPHTDRDREDMLRTLGLSSMEDLFEAIPAEARLRSPLRLPEPLDELSLVRHLSDLAGANASLDECVSFLGAGIYDHYVPAVVDALVSRGEFLTAYTPYQPELSQGMLQAMYEFQSLVCLLTGMDMANASMYDAATALAEAALMLVEVTQRPAVAVSRAVHPHYRQVLQAYATAADVKLLEIPYDAGTTSLDALKETLTSAPACVLFQHPNFFGCIEDLGALVDLCEVTGVRTVVAADPIALGLLEPPGSFGVDVVVGEGQPLCSPPSFGGPLLGLFACRAEYQRRFPGRIVGRTRDREGRRGFTMTLRTREQDIRREKATSNICTNEALLALAAAISLCTLGPQGLREMAELSLQKAHYAAERLAAVPGVGMVFEKPFFKEFALRLDTRRSVHDVCRRLREQGILAGYPLGQTYPEIHDGLLVCVTERRTREEIDQFVEALGKAMEGAPE